MLVKEIERVGIPAVQICTIVPIAQTAGANRIVQAVAIPHPVGAPQLPKKEEDAARRDIVEQALKALMTDTITETQLATDCLPVGRA